MKADEKISLGAIAKALAYGDFVFFYQPIVSLTTGKIFGAEALIRWVRNDGSLIPASMFIPLAEETGFITEISKEMLPKLMGDITAIHQAYPSLVIAFNVSARDIAARDFLDSVSRALQEYSIDPHRFRIEITEQQVVTINAESQEAISRLCATGIQFAIDDYGSGYSSLALLRDLPITALKIDQSYVRQIFTSEKSSQIVQHTITLAHLLGITTTAEGVETRDEFDFLLYSGCDRAQGFYISRPLPLSDFLAFLTQPNDKWHAPPLGLIYLSLHRHLDWKHDFLRKILNMCSAQDEDQRQKAYERMHKIELQEQLFCQRHKSAEPKLHERKPFDQIQIKSEQFNEAAELLAHAAYTGASKEQIAQFIRSLNTHSFELQKLLQEFHTDVALEYKEMI